MLAIAAVYRRATLCCGVVSIVRPRQQMPLAAPAERAILTAPPRFAAPAHVQSKSLGPARGWRCWSASGAKIRLTGGNPADREGP